MPDRSRKRPRDPNQLAKFIVDLATGETSEAEAPPELEGKNPAAVALGRMGGLKGGKARAKALSAKRRADIAKKAASNRWGKRKRHDA
jgi:hypothetical protein